MQNKRVGYASNGSIDSGGCISSSVFLSSSRSCWDSSSLKSRMLMFGMKMSKWLFALSFIYLIFLLFVVVQLVLIFIHRHDRSGTVHIIAMTGLAQYTSLPWQVWHSALHRHDRSGTVHIIAMTGLAQCTSIFPCEKPSQGRLEW